MKKLNYKFLAMGVTAVGLCVGALSLTVAAMNQDSTYNDLIVKPADKINSFLGIHNQIKEKYSGYIEDNNKILRQLHVPENILSIDVILKTSDTSVDKIFFPLMKFGHSLFRWDEENRINAVNKAKGIISANVFNFNSQKNINNEYIIMGLSALEDKSGVYKDFYSIFDKNEEKMTSFIYFHEFGHHLSYHINDETNKISKVIEKFEAEKNLKLSSEDKNIIGTQMRETFADSFALNMMKIKYPDIDFNKTRDLLAGMRVYDVESTHLTSPGIIDLKENKSLNLIINEANKNALTTAQFYSQLSFSDSNGVGNENRALPVDLIKIDTSIVRANIDKARNKFIETIEAKLPKI